MRLVLRVLEHVVGLVAASVLVLLGLAWEALGARPGGARLERMQASPQWGEAADRFVNGLPDGDARELEAVARLLVIDLDDPASDDLPPLNPDPLVMLEPRTEEVRDGTTTTHSSVTFPDSEGNCSAVAPWSVISD